MITGLLRCLIYQCGLVGVIFFMQVHHGSHGHEVVRELVDQGAMAQLLELLDEFVDQTDKFALWIQVRLCLLSVVQVCGC